MVVLRYQEPNNILNNLFESNIHGARQIHENIISLKYSGGKANVWHLNQCSIDLLGNGEAINLGLHNSSAEEGASQPLDSFLRTRFH